MRVYSDWIHLHMQMLDVVRELHSKYTGKCEMKKVYYSGSILQSAVTDEVHLVTRYLAGNQHTLSCPID